MSSPDQFSRGQGFEVWFPLGTPHNTIQDFLGYAAGAGGMVAEHPPEEPVTLGELQVASADLWGSPAYGTFAAGMLGFLSDGVKRGGRVVNRGGLLQVVVSTFGLPPDESTIGPASEASRDEIDRQVLALLNKLDNAPFPFALSEPSSRSRRTDEVRAIVPLTPTKPRIANFLKARGLHTEKRHGAVGKAIYLLAKLGGLSVEGSAEDRNWPGEFIVVEDIEPFMGSRGLSAHQSGALQRKVNVRLMHQVLNPLDAGESEMVVETSAAALKGEPAIDYDRVAVDSFADLESTYSNSAAAVKAHLRHFPQRYANWIARQNMT